MGADPDLRSLTGAYERSIGALERCAHVMQQDNANGRFQTGNYRTGSVIRGPAPMQGGLNSAGACV
jgi:hypothetical protein